jgi:hypothetical protein
MIRERARAEAARAAAGTRSQRLTLRLYGSVARGFGLALPLRASTPIHSPLFGSERRSGAGLAACSTQSIVDVYERYRNRRALDELRAHRVSLLADLKTLTGPFDVSKPIAELEDEIAIIEAGLAKLNTAAAA